MLSTQPLFRGRYKQPALVEGYMERNKQTGHSFGIHNEQPYRAIITEYTETIKIHPWLTSPSRRSPAYSSSLLKATLSAARIGYNEMYTKGLINKAKKVLPRNRDFARVHCPCVECVCAVCVYASHAPPGHFQRSTLEGSRIRSHNLGTTLSALFLVSPVVVRARRCNSTAYAV